MTVVTTMTAFSLDSKSIVICVIAVIVNSYEIIEILLDTYIVSAINILGFNNTLIN